MARSTASARSTATVRPPVVPWTKSWSFNGSTSIGSNAAIDYSAQNRLLVSFWVRLQTSGGTSVVELSTNYNTSNTGFAVGTSGGSLTVGYRDASGYSNWTSAALSMNRWYHFAGMLDRTVAAAAGAKTYINGVQSGAISLATAATGGFFGNLVFNVGARSGPTAAFKGQIKDLRVHSFTTFSANDALDLYAGRTPSTATPLNRWEGEDAGATATDAVGGKDLTLSSVTYATEAPTKARTTASARTAA